MRKMPPSNDTRSNDTRRPAHKGFRRQSSIQNSSVYAGINLLFNLGIAFTTRMPVLKLEKAGYFFSPVNCFIAFSESATAAKAYSRIEDSYSATASSRGFSPRCACSNCEVKQSGVFQGGLPPTPRYGVMLWMASPNKVICVDFQGTGRGAVRRWLRKSCCSSIISTSLRRLGCQATTARRNASFNMPGVTDAAWLSIPRKLGLPPSARIR